jgi:hypothetical protein
MPAQFRAIGALPTILASLAAASPALAHGIVGDRFFPATLVTDDPAVADELSLPTLDTFKTGDDPPATETDISGEWSKRLTSNFGVSFDGGWTDLKTPSGDISGFQNFGTTFKYLVATDALHELMVSAGLEVEWGGTGDAKVGADRATTLTPTFYFGKGAGDLPDDLAWARPLALTGVIGYAVPLARDEAGHDESRTLQTGFALEYSLRYLASHVRDMGLPSFVNEMTPLVEVQLNSPLGGKPDGGPTGTIDPGVIWSGRRFQLGAEAIVPINGASGHAVGAIFQVHWFVDDLFPNSLGKPIW